MGALGHMLEERGFATVAIGLVRGHVERIRPPRCLWVPFQLGRPFGEPGDPAFQRRVLTGALDLLDRGRGPVILEDFPDDPPSAVDLAGWDAPFDLPRAAAAPATDGAAWTASMSREMASVEPFWRQARHRFGRTTVGVSGTPPAVWLKHAGAYLDGTPPGSAMPGVSPAVALRFMMDDLKAFYSEAVQSQGGKPSSRQIDGWFWSRTLAARLLRALRRRAIEGGDDGFRTVGGRFLVPAPYVEE